MRNLRLSALIALFSASLFAPPQTVYIAAQGAVIITGRVTDATTDAPLQGVEIRDTCQTLRTLTDSDGNYQVANDPNCPHGFSMTFYKEGYRFSYRPSFENPTDTRTPYIESRTVDVEMMPYMAGHVFQTLRHERFTATTTGLVDFHNVSAGEFQQGDTLFVDVVSLDSGSGPAFTVTLEGSGLNTIQLITGQSLAPPTLRREQPRFHSGDRLWRYPG